MEGKLHLICFTKPGLSKNTVVAIDYRWTGYAVLQYESQCFYMVASHSHFWRNAQSISSNVFVLFWNFAIFAYFSYQCWYLINSRNTIDWWKGSWKHISFMRHIFLFRLICSLTFLRSKMIVTSFQSSRGKIFDTEILFSIFAAILVN